MCIAGDCKTAWSQVGGSNWSVSGSDIYFNLGNVAIGTSATSSRLHVFNSTGDNILKLSRGASTSTIFRVGTDGALVIQNQSSDVLSIKDGNVGIGTTGPEARLEVSAGFPQMQLTTGTSDLSMKYKYTGASARTWRVGVKGSGSGVNGDIGSYYIMDETADSSNGRITINTSGNVGIGTTNPLAKLHVSGTSVLFSNNLNLQWRNAADNSSLTIMSYDGSNNLILNGHGANLILQTSGTEWLRLTQAGKVTIGTTTAAISGAGTLSVISSMADPTGNARFVNLRTDDDSLTTTVNAIVGTATTGTGARFIAFRAAATTETFGTEVGVIRLNNNAVAYVTTSDQRLKENIMPTSLGLETLMQIPVRDYNFIADPGKVQRQGFIAQELYTVYPEAVSVGGDDLSAPWSVEYGRLTPLIIKSVQELYTNIASLSLRIDDLERLAGNGSIGSSAGDFWPQAFDWLNNKLASGALAVIKAVRGVFDELEARLVQADRLEVRGGAAFHNGITIYDEDTDEPYCFRVKSAAAVIAPGECAE